MLQWKSGCDHYLLSYEHFYFQNLPPKWAWKTCVYRNIWNAAAGQRRPWRHWKILGIKVLIKHFRESGLAPETVLPTQGSRRFPKSEKLVIFGILTKGGPQEYFLESWNFRNDWKWYMLCKMRRWWRCCNGKVAATIICWVMSIFISKVCLPKWVEKPVFNETFGMPLRANCDRDVTEKYLESRCWSSTSRKVA